MRQYETLADLAPDDTTVAISIAAAAEGLGRLEAAIQWTLRAAAAGPADEPRSAAATASAFRTTFLAWGALAATRAGRSDEARAIGARLDRLRSDERRGARDGARVTLAWAHPELHPTLWTTAIGAPMPADEGDARLGIGSAVVPLRAGSAVEVRLELGEIEHAARLGATAVLTLVAPDGDRGAKVSTTVVSFARGAAATRRYEVDAGALRER